MLAISNYLATLRQIFKYPRIFRIWIFAEYSNIHLGPINIPMVLVWWFNGLQYLYS